VCEILATAPAGRPADTTRFSGEGMGIASKTGTRDNARPCSGSDAPSSQRAAQKGTSIRFERSARLVSHRTGTPSTGIGPRRGGLAWWPLQRGLARKPFRP